jgi:hypothetical protein
MVGKIKDLTKMWQTLDVCYVHRLEKYVTKARKQINNFYRYKATY